MQYEDFIRGLRRNPPVPENPIGLTDRIMQNLEGKDERKGPYLSFRVSGRQWQIINGIRTLLTTAAIFLIGFFIVQQRAVTSRLEYIESNMKNSRQVINPAESDLVMFRQIGSIIPTGMFADSLQEVLQINRKTLNYFVSRISELEDENLTLREKMQQYYIDSTNIIKSSDYENK